MGKSPPFQFSLRTLLIALVVVNMLIAAGSYILPKIFHVRGAHPSSWYVPGKLSRLRAALNQYWILYNKGYPVHPSVAGVTQMNNALVLQMLIYNDPNYPKAGNPRLRRGNLFDPFPSDRFDKSGAWLDPWGNPYVVLIDQDVNGDGVWDVRGWKIDSLEETAMVRSATGKRIYQQAWLYSFGPDGKDDGGYNAKHDAPNRRPSFAEPPYDDVRPH